MTASLSATPSATLVTFKLPALIPVLPSIVTVKLPAALAKDALFKEDKSFFNATEMLLLFLATVILSSPEKSTVFPFSTVAVVLSPLADRFQLYLFWSIAVLIASATLAASAIPAVAVAVPFAIVISCFFPAMVIFLPLAEVAIYVLSPLTASLLSAKLTSPLPESPVKARFTLFNCATLTASVSAVPAATYTI